MREYLDYWEAQTALEKLQREERENYRRHMELNPGDRERRADHFTIMCAYSAAREALKAIRKEAASA